MVRDLDVSSGGPSRSVPALAESQSRHENVEVAVWFQDRGKPIVPMAHSKVEYGALGRDALTLRSVVERAFRSAQQRPGSKVIHLHGLWSPLLHVSAKVASKERFPYIVSTRGMLSGWALGHKAWKKKLAWMFYQESDLQRAECLVASSEFELRDITARLPDARVEVIPNGCDARPQRTRSSERTRSLAPGVRWALALGRLHRVKGYAELIQAWANLRPTGWKLAIAGPDEDGYRSKLEELIHKLQLQEAVVMLGEVDDLQKWTLLDQCELLVAPSKAENFGMAIAEALQSGTPVITTTGTPWRELQEFDCGWWIEPDVVALERALEEATRMDAGVLRAKGARGQRLVEEKYSWDEVASRTVRLYQAIIARRAQ